MTNKENLIPNINILHTIKKTIVERIGPADSPEATALHVSSLQELIAFFQRQKIEEELKDIAQIAINKIRYDRANYGKSFFEEDNARTDVLPTLLSILVALDPSASS